MPTTLACICTLKVSIMGLHVWRHGTAQRLSVHKSRVARTRHEVTIENLT